MSDGDFDKTKEMLTNFAAQYLGNQIKSDKEEKISKGHLVRMRKENSSGLEILQSVFKNILNHPEETKYHILKKSNVKLAKAICNDFKYFLTLGGFTEDDGAFKWNSDKISELKSTWKVIETFLKAPEEKMMEFLQHLSTITGKTLESDEDYIDMAAQLDHKEKRDTLFIYFIRGLTQSGLSNSKSLEYLDFFISKGLNVSDPSYLCQFDQKILHFVPYGGTPLSVCLGLHSINGIEMLLERGADINAEDPFYHMTPLCIASIKKSYSVDSHMQLLNCLLNNGADPNKKTLQGLTPLGYAVTQGTLEIVEKLIDAGAICTVEHKLTDDFKLKQVLEKNKK